MIVKSRERKGGKKTKRADVMLVPTRTAPIMVTSPSGRIWRALKWTIRWIPSISDLNMEFRFCILSVTSIIVHYYLCCIVIFMTWLLNYKQKKKSIFTNTGIQSIDNLNLIRETVESINNKGKWRSKEFDLFRSPKREHPTQTAVEQDKKKAIIGKGTLWCSFIAQPALDFVFLRHRWPISP